MAVDEKEDFKGRRKRNEKHFAGEHKSPEILTSGFPANITVDDLYLYRKKKQNFSLLKDNLKVEEGSFKHLKSEYTRRFKNFFDILKSSLNGTEKDQLALEVVKLNAPKKSESNPEHNESFIQHLEQRPKDTKYGIMNAASNNEIANRSSSVVNHGVGTSTRPRLLLRRPTTLKIEGDFSDVTEYAEQFIEYFLAKRRELCRTPTSLKLGMGEMETKTETTDQFRKFDNVERARLIRKFTNLHLDGELDVRSEKQENFQPHQIRKRPPLVKKSTNLRLEGSYSLVPEYRHQFIQYTNAERPSPVLPSDNLKTAGLFENTTANLTSRGRTSPLIPFLRESYSYHDINEDRRFKTNVSSSRYPSNVSLNRTSSHPNLVNSTFNHYIDFDNRHLDKTISRRESAASINRLTDIKNVQQTKEFEYKNGNSRGRSRLRKPDNNFVIDGEINYTTTEKRTKSPHKYTEKKKILSRHLAIDPDSQSGDHFECQPEYRRAIRDYLIREKPPPGRRRRILEIPDITVDSDFVNDETISTNVNKEKDDSTKSKAKSPPVSPGRSPFTPKSPVLDSPTKTGETLKRNLKINTEPVRLSPDKKKRVFRRSSTPSPSPPEKPKVAGREQSPNLSSNWRRSEPKLSSSSDTSVWNSTETDPAFLIVNDRVPTRRSIRRNLNKEQKWMPTWYSDDV